MKKPANGASTAVYLAACAAWVGVALVNPWAALAQDRSGAVSFVLLAWGWVAWAGLLLALLVPAAVSLTAVRLVAPLAFAAAVADGRVVSVSVATAAFVLLMTADVADTLVQGSAYGAETRFLLRTPVPYFVPAVLVSAALVSALPAGTLLLAARNWAIGIPVTLAGLVLAWRAPVRLHRLSRRWLVIVPAGLVVHDHMVLAETMMLRRDNLGSVALRPDNGDAADLTGGVLRNRVLVGMNSADKVIVSPMTMRFLGTSEALHVQSFTVAPRRAWAAVHALVTPRA